MKEPTLGERIKTWRKRSGLSQTGLERATGIKREYLSKLENNELKNPTIGTLRKIAEKGFGISMPVFLDDLENPKSVQAKLFVVTQKMQRLEEQNFAFAEDIINILGKHFGINLKESKKGQPKDKAQVVPLSGKGNGVCCG